MGFVLVLSLLGALFPLLPSPSSAAPLCPDSLSTADQTHCLIKALEASDRQLQQALMGVAKEAQQVPGPTFQALWRSRRRHSAPIAGRCVPMPNRWASKAPAMASPRPVVNWLSIDRLSLRLDG